MIYKDKFCATMCLKLINNSYVRTYTYVQSKVVAIGVYIKASSGIENFLSWLLKDKISRYHGSYIAVQ